VRWAETTIITDTSPLEWREFTTKNLDMSSSYKIKKEKGRIKLIQRYYNNMLNRKVGFGTIGMMRPDNKDGITEEDWEEVLLSLDKETTDHLFRNVGRGIFEKSIGFDSINPSAITKGDWKDQNGLTYADHKKVWIRTMKRIIREQKDSDYIGRPIADYFKASSNWIGQLRHEAKRMSIPSHVRKVVTSVPTSNPHNWSYLLETDWETTGINLDYLEIPEILKEMAIAIERFELSEKVLTLSKFEFTSIYQNVLPSLEIEEEKWKAGMGSQDEYESIDLIEYLMENSGESEEVAFYHKNRIMWRLSEGLSINDKIFIKSITDGGDVGVKAKEIGIPTYWDWNSYYPSAITQTTPENHNFFPINPLVEAKEIRNKIFIHPNTTKRWEITANSNKLNIDIKYQNDDNSPVINHANENYKWGAEYPISEEEKETMPNLDVFEEPWMGLQHLIMDISVEFQVAGVKPINYVLGIPVKMTNLSTN